MPFDFELKRTWFAPGDKRRLNKLQVHSGIRLRAGIHRGMPDYLFDHLPKDAKVLSEPTVQSAPEPENMEEALGRGGFVGAPPVPDPYRTEVGRMAKIQQEADEQIEKNEEAKRVSRDTAEPLNPDHRQGVPVGLAQPDILPHPKQEELTEPMERQEAELAENAKRFQEQLAAEQAQAEAVAPEPPAKPAPKRSNRRKR